MPLGSLQDRCCALDALGLCPAAPAPCPAWALQGDCAGCRRGRGARSCASFTGCLLPPRGLAGCLVLCWKGREPAGPSRGFLAPLTYPWQSQSSPVPPTPSQLCPGCRTASIQLFITQQLAKTFIILTPLSTSWSWREQSARALGFPWGLWQYSPSRRFPGIIHCSSAISSLGVGARLQPGAAHAESGLLCICFAFICVKFHPLLPRCAARLSGS